MLRRRTPVNAPLPLVAGGSAAYTGIVTATVGSNDGPAP